MPRRKSPFLQGGKSHDKLSLCCHFLLMKVLFRGTSFYDGPHSQSDGQFTVRHLSTFIRINEEHKEHKDLNSTLCVQLSNISNASSTLTIS